MARKRGDTALVGREEPKQKKFGQRAVEEAQEQGVEVMDPEEVSKAKHGDDPPEQPSLPGAEAPVKPKLVRDGHIMVTFVKPRHDMDKEGNRLLGFDIAMQLTDDHKGELPPEVESLWKVLRKGHVPYIGVNDIAPQVIELRLDPKDGKPEMRIDAATISRAELAIVKDTGMGKASTFVRFSFSAVTALGAELLKFAAYSYDRTFWMLMKPSQGELEIGDE